MAQCLLTKCAARLHKREHSCNEYSTCNYPDMNIPSNTTEKNSSVNKTNSKSILYMYKERKH